MDLMQYLTSMVLGACCALADMSRDLSMTQSVHLVKEKQTTNHRRTKHSKKIIGEESATGRREIEGL